MSNIKAVTKLYENDSDVLFIKEVKVHETKGEKSKPEPRDIVADYFYLYVYKKAKQENKFPWVDIEKVEYKNEEKLLCLSYRPLPPEEKPRNLNFSSDELETQILPKIASILVRLIPVVLQKDTNISSISEKTGNNNKPCPASAITRFDAYCVSRNFREYTNIRKKLSVDLRRRTSKINVPDDENEIAQGFALASLSIDEYAEHYVFANQENDPYASIARIPEMVIPAKHLTFDHKCDVTFLTAIKYMLSKYQNHNVRGITVKNGQITDNKLLHSIIHGYDRLGLEAIGFENAFSDLLNEEFMNLLESEEFFKNVKYFQLSKQPGLPLAAVLQKLPNLLSFSVSQSGIEIESVLKDLSNVSLPNLKALDLSGNKISSQISGLKFPVTLEHLDISGVTFCQNGLVSLLAILCGTQFQNGLRLVANNLKADEEEMKKALAFLAGLKHSRLTGLSWCGNPVTDSLSEIVKRSKQLRLLHLDDCFEKGDAAFSALLGALQSSGVRRLSVCGSERRKLHDDVSKLLTAAKSMPRLESLEFAMNSAGDESLAALADVVKATPVSLVCGDGNGASFGTIEAAAVAAGERGRALSLSMPAQDAKEFGDEQKTRLIGLLTAADRTAPSGGDRFEAAFDYFQHECGRKDEFPAFASAQAEGAAREAAPVQEAAEDAEHLKKLLAAATAEGEKSSESSESEPYSWEDDVERQQRQAERRNFYLDVNDETSVLETEAAAYDGAHEEPRLITEDGFVEPRWDDFDESVLAPFDNDAIIQRLEKKYSLAILRENIR